MVLKKLALALWAWSTLVTAFAQEWPARPVRIATAAQLPGFDLSAWVGVIGPAGMPPAVVDRLSTQIASMLARREIADKLASLGAEVAPGSAAELDAYMKRQLEVWGRKVKDAGIQPE